MPSELLRRIDLDKLYPPFLERLLDAIADCKAVGRNYVATLGMRTFEEQDALYAKGRTTISHVLCNCPSRKHLLGHTVTNAPGGLSAHNYGLAVDFFAGDWDPASYALLGDMVRGRGLIWGGDWKHPDYPHVQWPGYVSGMELGALKEVFLTQAESTLVPLVRVWKYIDGENADA